MWPIAVLLLKTEIGPYNLETNKKKTFQRFSISIRVMLLNNLY